MSAFNWHFRELFLVCARVCVYLRVFIPTLSLLSCLSISVPGSERILCYFYFRPVRKVFICMKERRKTSLTEKWKHLLKDVYFFYRVMSGILGSD